MTQRTLAAVIALPLVVGLVIASWLVSMPYSVHSPGPTINVLGDYEGEPIVQVSGHKSYRDNGEIRLTTVTETTADAELDLWTLMGSWIDGDSAVLPYDIVHRDDTSAKEERQQGQVLMASSQDEAIAAAFNELGYDVTRATVASVVEGGPSDGVLRQDDIIERVGDTDVRTPDEVVAEVQDADPGKPLRLVIERGGERRTVTVTPAKKDGTAYVGIAVGATYDFPFEVSLEIDPDIGGPSAGTMMAASVYDELTPGSLTGGRHVAGTGTITADGAVGRIGGIRQKIAGAQDAGAELFLVPADNCVDVAGVDSGDMRLAGVGSLTEAIDAIETFGKDPDAPLPQCGPGAGVQRAGGR